MTYQEFVEYIKNRAEKELFYDQSKFYPKGFISEDSETNELIRKCNIKYFDQDSDYLLNDCLLLTRTGKNRPIGYLIIPIQKLYEYANKYGAENAFSNLYSVENIPNIDVDQLKTRISGKFDTIRDRLIVRPLNYEMYKEDLVGAVYRRISDFALVLYHLINDEGDTISSSKIKKDELQKWDVGDKIEAIIDEAINNTARLFPACVYDTRTDNEVDLLTGKFSRKDVQILGEQILVTTFRSTNGAAALFYPGVVEKLMKVMGGPFAAVFMNINDVMIMNTDDPLIDKFAEVGSRTNAMGEMLSKKSFICDETGIHER